MQVLFRIFYKLNLKTAPIALERLSFMLLIFIFSQSNSRFRNDKDNCSN